jgi:hypothetical protein
MTKFHSTITCTKNNIARFRRADSFTSPVIEKNRRSRRNVFIGFIGKFFGFVVFLSEKIW